MSLRDSIGYYLLSSYRRKLLDKLLFKYSYLYKGVVFDIGGRDRGKFKSPKNSVKKWIVADIEESRKPDIVLDVCNMNGIKNESIDVINALELFEHVKEPEQGLQECYRILKKNGCIIISMPFLYPIHADPCDFQRWTRQRWEQTLQTIGFKNQNIISMGGFFTILADMLKSLNMSMGLIKYFGLLFYPIIDIMVNLDKSDAVKKNQTLNRYTTGYFIIAHK